MDTKGVGKSLNHKTVLVSCIIQNNSNGFIMILFFQLFQKSNKAVGANAGGVGIGGYFFGDGVDRTHYIDTVATR